jgi:PAS domain S-box-containing protein
MANGPTPSIHSGPGRLTFEGAGAPLLTPHLLLRPIILGAIYATPAASIALGCPDEGQHMQKPTPTGRETTFGENEVIVSKTDKTGRITYANDIFVAVSKYPENELIGQQHNIIRHPAMPRAVFKLVWDTILSGKEIFGYVLNLNREGEGYWVFAHITPNFDRQNAIVGFHSNRRKPRREAIDKIWPIYRKLLQIEEEAPNSKVGLENSFGALVGLLESQNTSYEEFVYSL